MLKEVASAIFLSTSGVDVPNNAPNSTSSFPIDENVGRNKFVPHQIEFYKTVIEKIKEKI